MRYILLLILSFTLLLSHDIIIDNSDKVNITPQVSYFFDEFSEYDENTVLTQHFKDSNITKLMFGYQFESTLWLKFTLVNPTDRPIEKILEYDYPILREFTLYKLGSGEIVHGGFLHAKNYDGALDMPVYITLSPNSENDFLIKANSTEVGLIAKLILWNPKAYYQHDNQKKYILFLFLGAVASLLLYNMSLFAFTKDKAYLFYSISMFTFLAVALFLDGFYTFIYPEYEVKKWHLYLLIYFGTFGIVFFIDTFLQLKKNLPHVHRLVLFLFGFLSIVVIGALLDFIPTMVHRASILISFFLLMLVAIYAYRKNIPQAKYYIVGWSLLLLFITIEILNQVGVFNLFGSYPFIGKLNIFLEALLFSIVLSARIRLLQQEKEVAVQKLYEQTQEESVRLEQRVQERTKELANALEENQTLLQEVHHRVKNNLQIIISLLRLQADETEDEVLQRVLTESENRVRAISSVHEMLYQNESLRHIDTQSYFESLCDDIKSSYGTEYHINVAIDAQPSLSMDKAVYCGLIVNELVTNAYKHAFTDKKGTIAITLHHDKGFTLVVGDDGNGIQSHAKESLGTLLVKTLVKKQLKGTMKTDTSQGTQYTINFENGS